MAYVRKQLEALQAALAKGEHRVAFDGKVVEYRSIAELKDAIREVEKDLRLAKVRMGTDTPVTRQIRVTTGKGF